MFNVPLHSRSAIEFTKLAFSCCSGATKKRRALYQRYSKGIGKAEFKPALQRGLEDARRRAIG